MNMRTIVVLLLLTVLILAGVPGSFAIPQYLANLSSVYGDGSCTTCHVNSTDGPRNSYGMLFENQSGHASNASAALIAIGHPPAEATLTPAETSTPVLTETTAPIPAVTTQASPGFGFTASLVGLFVCFILAWRHNK